MPLIDLVNDSRNDEEILSLWLVLLVSTDDCGNTFITKILFACRSDFEMLVKNGLKKNPRDNGKDLLTNRKDPWAESKDLKGLT